MLRSACSITVAVGLTLGAACAADAAAGARAEPLYILTWKQTDLREGLSAERLLSNFEVRGPGGEKLGTIENLLIRDKGRVSAIILESGGFFDVGDTHFRVPWREVTFDTALRFATVPLTRANYKRYGDVRDEQVRLRPGEWLATDLLGDPVILKDGTPYGRADDFIIALDGEVRAIVVTAEAGVLDDRFAFPYTHDVFDRRAPAVALPYDRSTVGKLPRFDYRALGVIRADPEDLRRGATR